MIIVLYYNVLYIYVTKNKSTRPPFSAGCQGKCDHLWKSHQLREGLAVCFWSLELHGAKLPEEESHLFHGSLGNWWKLDVWDSKIEGLEIVESLSSGFFFPGLVPMLRLDQGSSHLEATTVPSVPVSRRRYGDQRLKLGEVAGTLGHPPYPLVNSHNYGTSAFLIGKSM